MIKLYTYTGGKSKFLNEILANLPKEYNTFWDVFCGSGVVGLNSPKGHKIVLNDKNKIIVETFKYIKSDYKKIIENLKYLNTYDVDLKLYQEYRKEFNNLIKEDKIDLYVVIIFLFLLTYSFNNLWRVNKNGEFNSPWDKRPKKIYYLLEKKSL